MTSRRRQRLRLPADQADADVAVTRVYDRHAGAIAAYALRRAHAADAADVVADTFLVAWRRHGEIPDEPATLPWLYGVARRVLANQRRAHHRRTRLHDRLRTEFIGFVDDADGTEHAEQFRQVASALAALSIDDAELLRLTAWEGLSPTELATTMDLTPSAVRQRLRRARQRLRQQLASRDSTRPDHELAQQLGAAAPHCTSTLHEATWSIGGGS